MTDPINEIHPKTPYPEINTILKYFSDSIDEVVNYGTHLLKWIADSTGQGDYKLPTMMFFRSLLEKADSISILVRHSSIDPSKAILRSLFETHLSIAYLNEKYCEDRSMAFLVWNSKNIISANRAFIKGNQEFKELKSRIEKDSNYLTIEDLENLPSAKPIIDNQISLLNKPEYNRVEKEYERTKKLINNPSWYSLFNGPRNIEQLAKDLNMSTFYPILYRPWSGSVHGTDIINGKIVKSENSIETDGKVGADIIQLRLPTDAQQVSAYTLVFLFMTYNKLIEEIIPSKKQDYLSWYLLTRSITSKITNKEQLINVKF